MKRPDVTTNVMNWPEDRPEGKSDQFRKEVNAFSSDFLHRIDELPDPASAGEAEWSGPWAVAAVSLNGEVGFGVVRSGNASERTTPEAWFARRSDADVAAALLPALGTTDSCVLSEKPDNAGYGLSYRGERFGNMARYLPEAAELLSLAKFLVRSPAVLATLLLAAGPQATILVGQQLASRLRNQKR